jgi:hypothetical protein
MGNVRFDESFVIFEVIVVSVVLLLFLVEEFEGAFFVFLLVASSPIFNDSDDPIWHGEGGDGAGFFDYACINVEYLVCALAVASRTEEYSGEPAGAHSICDGRIVVGFNVGAKGGFAVFLEVDFAAEVDLPGGVLVGHPGCCWEAIKPEYGKVDKVDDHLARKRCVGNVQHECAAAFFNGVDETFDFTDVFAPGSGVNLHHLAGIFDLVKFLIHHDDADSKTSASV